jgi:hypothetical protein
MFENRDANIYSAASDVKAINFNLTCTFLPSLMHVDYTYYTWRDSTQVSQLSAILPCRIVCNFKAKVLPQLRIVLHPECGSDLRKIIAVRTESDFTGKKNTCCVHALPPIQYDKYSCSDPEFARCPVCVRTFCVSGVGANLSDPRADARQCLSSGGVNAAARERRSPKKSGQPTGRPRGLKSYSKLFN